MSNILAASLTTRKNLSVLKRVCVHALAQVASHVRGHSGLLVGTTQKIKRERGVGGFAEPSQDVPKEVSGGGVRRSSTDSKLEELCEFV